MGRILQFLQAGGAIAVNILNIVGQYLSASGLAQAAGGVALAAAITAAATGQGGGAVDPNALGGGGVAQTQPQQPQTGVPNPAAPGAIQGDAANGALAQNLQGTNNGQPTAVNTGTPPAQPSTQNAINPITPS